MQETLCETQEHRQHCVYSQEKSVSHRVLKEVSAYDFEEHDGTSVKQQPLASRPPGFLSLGTSENSTDCLEGPAPMLLATSDGKSS